MNMQHVAGSPRPHGCVKRAAVCSIFESNFQINSPIAAIMRVFSCVFSCIHPTQSRVPILHVILCCHDASTGTTVCIIVTMFIVTEWATVQAWLRWRTPTAFEYYAGRQPRFVKFNLQSSCKSSAGWPGDWSPHRNMSSNFNFGNFSDKAGMAVPC